MIQLRGGQLTHDKRLDRVIYFDPRSKNYPVRTVITNSTPRSYTWSLKTVLDQGNEGSCVGHAFAHELAAIPKKIATVNSELAIKIYKDAQKVDEWSGEQYEGTSVIAGASVSKLLGYYKEYRWAFGLDDLILAIGRQGPAVLGLNWYSGMFDTDANGFIHAKGFWAGGHAIIARGVSLKGKYVTLTNSWGTGWGVNGDCKISFEDLDKLLKEQGEACIPIGRMVI